MVAGRRMTTWLGGLVGAAAVATALAGCGGGSKPTVAVKRIAPERYETIGAATSPRDAYYAWKAADTGKTWDEVRKADDGLSTTKNPFGHDDPVVLENGRAVYQAHCVNCHGAAGDGRGKLTINPTSKMDFRKSHGRLAIQMTGRAPASWFKKVSDGYTSKQVNPDGWHNAMPAMKQVLSREQIWLAMSYVEALAVGKAPGGEK